jgi:hypothetical protein
MNNAERAPNNEKIFAMEKLIDEMTRVGDLLAAKSCLPSSKGTRVRLSEGKFRSVTDGPFAETKELFG